MAVTVGNRVQSMIDHMEKGELDLARKYARGE